jgi:hypothetical protein
MPSLPKCFNLLNDDYFNNLISSLTAVGDAIPPNASLAELQAIAADLQSTVDSVYGDISLLESTITSQIALLGPIAALLTAPGANPTAIVTWITSFITDFLTPYVIPFTTYASQLTALGVQVAALTAAIENLAATKLPGITITIPPIVIGCTL